MPAKAGIQLYVVLWIPAFAGMTTVPYAGAFLSLNVTTGSRPGL